MAGSVTPVSILAVVMSAVGLWPETLPIAGDDPLGRVYASCRSHVDSLGVLKASAALKIFDPKFLRVLHKSSNRNEFEERLDRYRRADTARWDRFLTNFAYCQHVCRTPIWTAVGARDIRWEYMLVHGPPAVEWEVLGEPWAESARSHTTTVYLYTWPDRTSAALAADTIGGHPVRDLERFPIAERWRPIYPTVEATTFPRLDRALSDLGISILITGDQFNRATIERGLVDVDVRLSREDRPVADDSIQARLDLVGAGIGVLRDLEMVGATIHFVFDSLPPGDYELAVRITGSQSNYGKRSIRLVIPSPRVVGQASDLLFLVKNPPRGDVLPGIKRGDRTLYGRALNSFPRSDTIHSYVEWLTAPCQSCSIKVTAVPTTVRGQRGRPTVTVGPIASIIEAESGRPWGEQFWKKQPPEPSAQNRADEMVVFSGAYPVAQSPFVFEQAFPVAGIKPGGYWLIVQATSACDPHVMLAWSEIEIY